MPTVRLVTQDLYGVYPGRWHSFMTPQRIQSQKHWFREVWRLIPESRCIFDRKGELGVGWSYEELITHERIVWTFLNKNTGRVYVEVNRKAGGMGR